MREWVCVHCLCEKCLDAAPASASRSLVLVRSRQMPQGPAFPLLGVEAGWPEAGPPTHLHPALQVSFRYHCQLYSEWRRTNQKVRLKIRATDGPEGTQHSSLAAGLLKKVAEETPV